MAGQTSAKKGGSGSKKARSRRAAKKRTRLIAPSSTSEVGSGRGVARAADASPAAIIGRITAIAAASPIATFSWKNRGRAPLGYIKGMAVTFARVYCKFLSGNPAAADMAKADTQAPREDALSWYAPEFEALGMSNGTSSADTLRHLFVLLTGLGMRESSGKHCEGRDMSASNITGETAEAGLFQVSYNARNASSLLPPLFAAYRGNPSGFVEVFREGITCSASNLRNWGNGDGVEFQRLSKACPAFAAEFAAVGLRHRRRHWGPINTKKTEVIRDCDTLFRDVQEVVDSAPGACSVLQ